jgi:hypothetical protein
MLNTIVIPSAHVTALMASVELLEYEISEPQFYLNPTTNLRAR